MSVDKLIISTGNCIRCNYDENSGRLGIEPNYISFGFETKEVCDNLHQFLITRLKESYSPRENNSSYNVSDVNSYGANYGLFIDREASDKGYYDLAVQIVGLWCKAQNVQNVEIHVCGIDELSGTGHPIYCKEPRVDVGNRWDAYGEYFNTNYPELSDKLYSDEFLPTRAKAGDGKYAEICMAVLAFADLIKQSLKLNGYSNKITVELTQELKDTLAYGMNRGIPTSYVSNDYYVYPDSLIDFVRTATNQPVSNFGLNEHNGLSKEILATVLDDSNSKGTNSDLSNSVRSKLLGDKSGKLVTGADCIIDLTDSVFDENGLFCLDPKAKLGGFCFLPTVEIKHPEHKDIVENFLSKYPDYKMPIVESNFGDSFFATDKFTIFEILRDLCDFICGNYSVDCKIKFTDSKFICNYKECLTAFGSYYWDKSAKSDECSDPLFVRTRLTLQNKADEIEPKCMAFTVPKKFFYGLLCRHGMSEYCYEPIDLSKETFDPTWYENLEIQGANYRSTYTDKLFRKATGLDLTEEKSIPVKPTKVTGRGIEVKPVKPASAPEGKKVLPPKDHVAVSPLYVKVVTDQQGVNYVYADVWKVTTANKELLAKFCKALQKAGLINKATVLDNTSVVFNGVSNFNWVVKLITGIKNMSDRGLNIKIDLNLSLMEDYAYTHPILTGKKLSASLTNSVLKTYIKCLEAVIKKYKASDCMVTRIQSYNNVYPANATSNGFVINLNAKTGIA